MKIYNIIITIISIILIIIIINNNDNNKDNIGNIDKLIKYKYNNKIDSLKYIFKLNNEKKYLDKLNENNLKLKKEYNIKYKYIKKNITDTIIIKEFINVSDSIIHTMEEIISKKDTIIIIKDEYIDKLEYNEVEINNILNECIISNNTLNENNLKLKKKLKRTRKIGIFSTIFGFFGGLIVKK